ncbi:MAG: HEAT repeat domain-containing protein [Planctomycetota bacterium]|jgi:hypothetical protein
MNPTVSGMPNRRMPNRRFRTQVCMAMLACLAMSLGCQSWITRKKEEKHEKEARLMKEKLADPDRPRLAGEIATPIGLTTHRYDAIGLLSSLPGTGGMVNPSAQREMMLTEMRRHEVLNPEGILDSPSTAIAKVRVFVDPCMTKSDNLDVLVECSDECNATDLRGGYLMPTMLREYMFLDGKNRSSNDKSIASGEFVTIPASLTGEEKINPLRGIVIGGGKLMDTPKLGIRVGKEWRHVMVVGSIADAINRRFFYQDGTRQQKVAEGKNDWHIELQTAPKYRWDPMHYMSTVMSIGFRETDEQISERIEGCRKLLMRRETARRAACELEAIGKGKATEVLLEGLLGVDAEVRFYSAYSLAYMDRSESVPILRALAIDEPAFRPLCLIGLGINEHPSARNALLDLLQESEPELCYGALLALRQRNPRDPTVLGERIGEVCQLIQIPSKNSTVAVSLEQQKEVVVFGGNSTITLNRELSPTPSLRIVPLSGGLLRLAKIQLEGEVLQSIISNDLESLLRAMPSVNASYNDMVHALDQLGTGNHLAARVAINPRPRAGRIYRRDASGDEAGETTLETVQVDASSRINQKQQKKNWISMATLPSIIPSKKPQVDSDKSKSTDSRSEVDSSDEEEGNQP